MCASCGCGCKPGKEQKGCKCNCKTCREARTMSVEKFHLVRKAQRGFEAIADAVLNDVVEDDLLFDDEGNAYILVDVEDVEKSDKSDNSNNLGRSAAKLGGYTAAVGGGAYGLHHGFKAAEINRGLKKWKASGRADASRVQQIMYDFARGAKNAHLKHAGIGAGVAAAGVGVNALANRDKKVEKSDKSRRYASNAAIGAGTAATGAGAAFYGMGAYGARKTNREGHMLAHAINSGVADLGARTAAIGGGIAGAGLGLRAYNKKKSKLANRDKKVEKGLPSIARQAIREGKGTEAFNPQGALRLRMSANGAGRNAARDLKQNMPLNAGESMNIGRNTKEYARTASGVNRADVGQLGGVNGRRRLREATAAREAKQKQIAMRLDQERRLNGRGVLP